MSTNCKFCGAVDAVTKERRDFVIEFGRPVEILKVNIPVLTCESHGRCWTHSEWEEK